MGIGDRFDKLADHYDTVIKKRIPQYGKFTEVIFSLLPYPPDSHIEVLDLGIGTGNVAQQLLEKYPNAKLVGVDVSPKMLQQASLKLALFKTRIKVVQGDLAALPQMGSFDLVYSILAIHHLSDEEKQTLFKKIFTQLKPGGIFILIDVVKGTDERLTEIYLNSTFSFDEYDKPASLIEQLEWLKNAGFEKIDVPWKDYKLTCIIASRREKLK
jgi:tRNA (cmo5U34)-methyltransferase